ncbi:MAG: phenylalanine--tRNA ligase subunit beta [Patescibacteria group bacterium]
MNILASYNWIKEYLKTSLSPEEFAREMSLKSMSVESIDYLAQRFEKMVIGEVTELKAHPDADKLKLAMTNIGGEVVQIVCGGQNLRQGMRVLVALPGSSVKWHGEGDFVELKEVKIRGEQSFGMICAPAEVGFEKFPCREHDIWDLDDLTQAKAGTSFAKAFNLDDQIFDIEVTTNRPDSMSIIGLAREAGAATESIFDFTPSSLPQAESGKDIKITVKDSDLCPRYMAVVIDGVKVGPSPLWLQQKILLSGHRPINNIVDITNYVLHEYGQPLHAFDYEKLRGGEIIVRRAKDGEKFLALDENEYKLKSDNLVIADSEGPVAIAGVMGGVDSGTWEGTTTIVFEAAAFDSVSIRRTSRALNLYSDSQLLFEKGLSTESPAQALARAIELTLEVAGGEVVSEIKDERASTYQPLVFPFDPARVRDRMGVDISNEEQITILSDLGFKVVGEGPEYQVEVPFWRDHDIEDEVDFTEEIARIYGYHNLPSVLPQSPPPADVEDQALVWEFWIKKYLASTGFTEFYSNSFVGADDLSRYKIDPNSALVLYNPLSSDLSHMRTSLVPSLLISIDKNQGQVSTGKVFELSRVYIPQKDDVPNERTQLVIAEFGLENVEAAFLRLKGILKQMTEKSGLKIELTREFNDERWHSTRSAAVKINGENRGMIGQLAVTYQEAFGIDRPVVIIELDLEDVLPQMFIARSYTPIPEFPAINRDIAIVVPESVDYASLTREIKDQSSIIESVSLFDIYRGTGIPEGKKSMALSIVLRAPDKTLSSEHADDVMKAAEQVLKEKFGAIIR